MTTTTTTTLTLNLDSYQRATHGALSRFVAPYRPEQVESRLDELAREMAATRWMVPGLMGDYQPGEARELLLDWISTQRTILELFHGVHRSAPDLHLGDDYQIMGTSIAFPRLRLSPDRWSHYGCDSFWVREMAQAQVLREDYQGETKLVGKAPCVAFDISTGADHEALWMAIDDTLEVKALGYLERASAAFDEIWHEESEERWHEDFRHGLIELVHPGQAEPVELDKRTCLDPSTGLEGTIDQIAIGLVTGRSEIWWSDSELVRLSRIYQGAALNADHPSTTTTTTTGDAP